MQPVTNQALVNKLKLPNTQVRWFTLASKKKEDRVELERKSKNRIKAKESRRQHPHLTAREERRKQRAKDSRSRSNIGDRNPPSRRGKGHHEESVRSRSNRNEERNRANRRGAPESVISKKNKYYAKENTVTTPKSKAFPIKTESSDNVIKRRIRTQVWHMSKSKVKHNTHLMKLLADNKINIDDINVSRLHLNDLDMETIGVKNRCLKKALLWLFR